MLKRKVLEAGFLVTYMTEAIIMDFDNFDQRVLQVMRNKPDWFLEVENVASDEDIIKIESKLCSNLPVQFKHFSKNFGAGYFGMSIISSIREESDFYILRRPDITVEGRKMLIVSDDQSGGYFGFLSKGGQISNEIFYVAPDDGGYHELFAECFFDYIDKNVIPV